MLTILTITFPIFAMVGIGYLTVTKGLFRPADTGVLGGWVMNLALPALMFQALAARPISEVFHPGYMGAYMFGGVLTALITYIWFGFTTDSSRRGVAMMGTYCPNSGFIGYPLFVILFPSDAGLILAMNVLVENIVLIPLALIALDASKPDDGTGQSTMARLGTVFLGMAKRPLMIAIALGLVASAFGGNLPEAVDHLVGLMASSAAAVALFVIGGSLVGVPFQGNLKLAWQMVVGKLLIMPLMTGLSMLALAALGFGFTDNLRDAVLISGALPTMVITAVLAQELGRGAVASLAILLATITSFFTLNALLLVLM